MGKKKLPFGSLAFSAGPAATQLTFSKAASSQPASHNSYDAIDAYIEEQVQQLNVPGLAFAIVEGERLVHYRGFGKARPHGEVPTLQTPFFIGSVTKSFTALAVMQLVEAGKVELDAPIQRYLPWFRVADPEASARMTIRHLLNHTSGLSMAQGQMVLANLEDGWEAAERQLRALSTAELSHPVGMQFAYNNTNYNLLGLIVQVVSGEEYPEYIQKHIFDPLGMSRSYTSKAEAQRNGLAMGYRYWFGCPVPAPNLNLPLASLPSGQLISCAQDMAHYLGAILNGGRYGGVQMLSSAGIAEMQRGTAEIIQMGQHLGTYAMGWESVVVGKTTIVSHSGIVPDFGAFAGLIPEQKKGLVLLYNANHAMLKMTFDELGMGATERLAGETPSKKWFGFAPWLMRGMALIPVLQAVGVVTTLRRVKRWNANPASQPGGRGAWGQHILLPLVPNLLAALTLVPALGKMRGWVTLFMPDFAWIARICGGFAAVWAFFRTGLVLHAMRKK